MSFSSSTTRTVRLIATSEATAPVDRPRVLPDDVGGTPGDEPARRRENDDDVVDLAEHGDHIRDQVEGEDDVGESRDQHRLRPDRDPRVAKQTPVQADEVREMKDDLENPSARN